MTVHHDDIARSWQESLVILPAKFQGLRTFRQFALTDQNPAHPPLPLPYSGEFRLKSVIQHYTWLPRDNQAICATDKPPHPIPSRHCVCGFYGSYSSQIIYQPFHLNNSLYCFAAIRQYGDVVLAQNGLRSSGADVEGVLFHPKSRHHLLILQFWEKLEQEGIFFTTSAQEFLKKFPDQSYQDILKFDPVKRTSEKVKTIYPVQTTAPRPPMAAHDIMFFCRPLRFEMMEQKPSSAPPVGSTAPFDLSIKPEYRPGGKMYRHPLFEVWPS